MSGHWVSVRVKGDFACFTRPENKVERVTYPVITPSAARGVLEAIFWHPEFDWRIREIHVLSPVRTFAIMRNEVKTKMVQDDNRPYFADEDRAQRNSVVLRDVDYAIFAETVVKPDKPFHPQKYSEQFERRVQKGQCFHRPALGCREFAAEFMPWDQTLKPVEWSEDLGLILWDLDYSSGKPPYWPGFFNAIVENGIIRVPDRPVGGGT